MYSESKYSIIIPVYKSVQSLVEISEQLNKLSIDEQLDIEVIFVNDSPQFLETKNILKELEIRFNFVTVITLRKNIGQHLASLTGISKASGDYIITMDDDLQHPVSEIPKLIKAITSDVIVEAVFGIPNYLERKHSYWRSAGSYFLKKIDLIFLKKPKGLILSSFRIMTRDLAGIIVETHNAMPSISNLMVNASNDLKNVKVKHNSREFGTTNYTLAKLISLAFNGILYYSSLPLKILGIVGLVIFVFSMIFISIIIGQKIFNGIEFPGYASTVSLIAFFGGVNLFALGLIGEYLLRLLKEQQRSNLNYYIRNTSK